MDIDSHFYANMCHVCKLFGEGVQLKRCEACNMIAYCSVEHELEHRPTHEELCKAIIITLSEEGGTGIISNTYPDPYTWSRLKMKFMLRVRKNLDRPMSNFETEMFMFPRACMECQAQDNLHDCLNCASASFCVQHQHKIAYHNNCFSLTLAWGLETCSIPLDFTYIKHISDKEVFDWNAKDGMVNFFYAFVHPYIDEQTMNIHLHLALHSQYSTRPLTLLYAAKRINYQFLKKKLIIHVLASNCMEMESVLTWEILLHFIPILTDVKILFIGPELKYQGLTNLETLCEKCKSEKKKIRYEYRAAKYENINISKHTKPDLIIGFNTRINKNEQEYMDLRTYMYHDNLNSWQATIKELAKAKKSDCPIILTCYDDIEARYDMITINNILNRRTTFITVRSNPYLSFRPYRDPETENMVFQNSFIIIYSSLGSR